MLRCSSLLSCRPYAADASTAGLAATASGPSGQTALDQKPVAASFTAQLTTSGTHSLSVSLVDAQTQQALVLPVRGQSTCIRVVPGPVLAQRTVVQGMPRKLVAGVGCHLSIYPVDSFGNAGASGMRRFAFHCTQL